MIKNDVAFENSLPLKNDVALENSLPLLDR